MSSERDQKFRDLPLRRLLVALIVLPSITAVVGYTWLDALGPQIASGSWPTTSAVVTESETDWTTRSRRLRFRYTYSVNGVEYSSSRKQLNGLSSAWWFRSYRSYHKAHPPGSSLMIAFDPVNPSLATIRTGLSLHDLWVAPFMVAGGVWSGVLAWRELARRRRQHLAKKKYGSWACPNCGYNRRGLNPGAPCPECGNSDSVGPRRRHDR